MFSSYRVYMTQMAAHTTLHLPGMPVGFITTHFSGNGSYPYALCQDKPTRPCDMLPLHQVWLIAWILSWTSWALVQQTEKEESQKCSWSVTSPSCLLCRLMMCGIFELSAYRLTVREIRLGQATWFLKGRNGWRSSWNWRWAFGFHWVLTSNFYGWVQLPSP